MKITKNHNDNFGECFGESVLTDFTDYCKSVNENNLANPIYNEIYFDCFNAENLKFWIEIMTCRFPKKDFGGMQLHGTSMCKLDFPKNHKKVYYFAMNDCYKLNNIAMSYFANKETYENLLKEINFLSGFICVGTPNDAILELKHNLAVQKNELLNEIENIFDGKIRMKFEFNY